jgi:hypothetical protein
MSPVKGNHRAKSNLLVPPLEGGMIETLTGSQPKARGDFFSNWYIALDKLVAAAVAYSRARDQRNNGILFPTLEAAAFLFAQEDEKLLRTRHDSPRSQLAWCPFCLRLMNAATALGAAFEDYVTLPTPEFRSEHASLVKELASAALRLPAARAESHYPDSTTNKLRDYFQVEQE